MPFYDLHCPKCDRRETRTARVAESDKQVCDCGETMTIEIAAPRTTVDRRHTSGMVLNDGSKIPLRTRNWR